MNNNFYITIGNKSSLFPIAQYCRTHTSTLEKNNFTFIEIEDLYPELNSLPFNKHFYNTSWIIGDQTNLQNKFELPLFSEIITQLKKTVEKKSAKNIILLLNENSLAAILPELLYLKKTFSNAAFFFQYIKTDTLRECNCETSLQLLKITKFSLFPSFQQSFAPYFIRKQHTNNAAACKQIEKIFQASINPTIFSNEIDCFNTWSTFTKLQTENFFPLSSFAPEVIAFLFAVFEFRPLDENFYIDEELDFLTYKNTPSQLFSYYTKLQTEIIRKTFPEQITELTTCTHLDCSHASLRIKITDALKLAKLLSPKTRKRIIGFFDFNSIEYLSTTAKTIYLALLHAENAIKEKDIYPLLKRSKGRIHTNTETYSDKPILTVYTLTYNHEKYIKQCIESILAQKINIPFRHIIADGGSNDSTQEIIKEYAQKYPHIELILPKQTAYMHNYFSTINNLDTKYIAVCDGDDYYTNENKLQEQINLMEKNPEIGLCFHAAYIYYENEKNDVMPVYPTDSPQFTPKETFYLSNIIVQNLLQSSTAMFRSKISEGLYPAFPSFIGPYDWSTAIINAYNSKISYINKPMSLYRRHSNARYIKNETNAANHIILACYHELKFCYIMDICTDQKYHKLFMKKVFRILSTFYFSDEIQNIDKKVYENQKNQIEKCFPEYIIEFYKFNPLKFLTKIF